MVCFSVQAARWHLQERINILLDAPEMTDKECDHACDLYCDEIAKPPSKRNYAPALNEIAKLERRLELKRDVAKIENQ